MNNHEQHSKHSHEHSSHEHSHEHSSQGHSHAQTPSDSKAPTSKEELTALLSYMVSHNKHHAEELEDLAKNAEGEASIALQNAISSFTEGNRQLEIALGFIKAHI